MKFYVHNVSTRMHVIDRDIPSGAGVKPGVPAAEYDEESFAKYSKAFANAMQSTEHHLTRGYDIGSDSVYSPGVAELEIFAEVDGERGKMTVADVMTYAKDYAAKKAEEEAAKKRAEDKLNRSAVEELRAVIARQDAELLKAREELNAVYLRTKEELAKTVEAAKAAEAKAEKAEAKKAAEK